MLRGSLSGGAGENIEQVEIDFSPGVPMDRVTPAWASTVAETAALGARFVIRDGEAYDLTPATLDDPSRIEKNIPESWDAWLASDRIDPLPLETGLPWRAVIWPEAGKLIWTFHHALLDGRSITRILSAFQARLVGGEVPPSLGLTVFSPPTPEDVAAAEEFHRVAFASLKAFSLDFPADSGTGPSQVSCRLGSDIAARIESRAAVLQVTAATLLTWAWGQAAATAAGVDAVAVGQVRSGPPKPDQAGFSMSTVPLVISRAKSGPAYTDLLDLRQRMLALRAVENVSVELLPATLFQDSHGPWPAGVLMVQRGTLQEQVGKSDAIKAITLHEFSGEPLLASAWIHPDLQLEVEVDGTKLGARAAESLLGHWASVVRSLANDESTDGLELTALPTAEHGRIAVWEDGGPAVADLHLATAWHEAVENFTTECALWTPVESLSYKELDAQVQHLAAVLHEAGAKSGAPVASLLQSRKHLALVTLAIARIGAIHVPLDPALPSKRMSVILADAVPVLILADSPAACGEFDLPCVVVDGSTGKTCAVELPRDSRDTLCILYTSGSTGMPKGVMMVHGGVTNEVLGIARLVGIAPGSRVLQFASPGFDASLEEILATLLSGATLIPRPEEVLSDFSRFQSFIREAGVSVLDLPSAYWAAWCAWMVTEQETIPQTIRAAVIGGERASAVALQNWFSAGGRSHLLANTYGPTEASIVATVELIGESWNEPGDPAIGHPLPGVLAKVGDASGRPLPNGAAGELWLGGVCVGSGYWNRPDLTKISFQDSGGLRWYRTGDRVWRDDLGKLRFLGRQDDQLKIRGNRIEPDEVIRILETFPEVSSAHVGPVNVNAGSVHLAAWVRWKNAPEHGWPALLAAHAAGQLATAAIPTRWALVDEFKLTERGKLDRSQLPEPTLTASSHSSSEPPATPTEIRLASLWSALLCVGNIGRDESFFELGGHSLAALQLFAGISREWKIRIPLATLIQAPTPRMLAEIIDRESRGEGSGQAPRSIVVPIRPEGHLPPLFCIHGADGGVFFYRDLAEHLPPGRPLLAIEAPGLAIDGEVRPMPVEETAAEYIKALRQHHKEGPFYLTGYSYGGLLVFEIARQLVLAGQAVAFIGMVDTINPAATVRSYSIWERGKVFMESQKHLPAGVRLHNLLQRIRGGVATFFRVKKEIYQATTAGVTEPHSVLRMLQVREAHWNSTLRYQPKPLAGQITLFKSREVDDKFAVPDDYGWTTLVDSLDIAEVEGEHLEIFARQHVASLAGEIIKRI